AFYVGGTYVKYQGQLYKTRWDTMGSTMTGTDLDAAAVWEPVAGTEGYSLWQANLTYHGGTAVVSNNQTSYTGGEVVGYEGHLWQANWFNVGSIPSSASGSPWTDLGVIGGAASQSSSQPSPTTPSSPITPTAPTPSTPAPTPQAIVTPEWNTATAYLLGDQVNHNGKVYQARSNNQGSEPAGNATWLEVVPAASVTAWSGSQTYLDGDTVTYNGQVYLARWDTALGNTPGVDMVWTQVPAPGTARPWMAGVEYIVNQIVSHDGQLWKANWTTIPGNEPGVDHVWSQVVPAGSNPPWSAGPEYAQDQIVDYQGQHWKARWPSHGDIPGQTQAWTQAPDAGTYAPWGAGVTYYGGETIQYQGHLWLAQWFTLGDTPGLDSSYVWANMGVAPADPPPVVVPPVVIPPVPTRTTYDLLPMLTASANDLISRSFYDAAGHLSKTVSAAGLVTE
ncbi:carbohydrate-binding protein, partial [Undibacterium sp. Ji50W]|uniref:carbohydrate-binding protein n=1 Tax=Undibacterium sp. Ji50W TaxID=3413041 RepID=UPI003BF3D3AC